MKITPESKIVKAENSLLQELDREAVLLNLDNNQYYRLDENSLHMFKLMIISTNLSEAHKTLSTEYDVPAEKLWHDLIVFAEDLEKSGLVRVMNE